MLLTLPQNSEPREELKITFRIDEEGDCQVSYNGIHVFYIRAGDGSISKFYIEQAAAKALKGAGVNIEDSFICINN